MKDLHFNYLGVYEGLGKHFKLTLSVPLSLF